jgi:thiol-disulfide isomerase/thioredoxin
MSIRHACLVALLFTAGCEEAELEIPGLDDGTSLGKPGTLDSDGDGLLDSEEAELGTDPQSDDTDLDGWLDGEELDRNTDPVDGTDTPYTGGWPIGDCRNDIQADSSLSEGGIAPNFEAPDMYGDTIRLHDFCHMAVLVVTGAEWCGPCQGYRANMAQYMDQYFDQGLMVIDFLVETDAGAAPTSDDLSRWADGHNYAVASDEGWVHTNAGYASAGIPGISLLGPGAEVISLANGDPGGLIEGVLPANFAMPEYVAEDMDAAAGGSR